MIDPMTTIGYAIDRYLGELARNGRSEATQRTYQRVLNQFADTLPREWQLEDVTPDQCREFLDRWRTHSTSTRALYVSVLRGYFAYAHDEGRVKHNPMDRIRRPQRKKPEDLDVVTVSTADVRLLMQACKSWREHLCINVLVYLGPRRAAVSRLRVSDVDFDAGTIRFLEKGGKIIVKPIPVSLFTLLENARAAGVWESQSDYLIPGRGWPTRNAVRDDRVIYDIVGDVARRAGVKAHVHALRAAFAVYYLETHEGDLEALKHLMGHSRYETTAVYLRRLDRFRSMERVRDLNWADPLHANPVVPPAGFEPALETKPVVEPDSDDKRDFTHLGFDLIASIRRVLTEASA